MHKIKQKGFTLIETLIYIALFSILMGGAVATSYGLIDGTAKTQTKSTIQEEGNFVLRKLDWALTGTSTDARIYIPLSGQYASELSLRRENNKQVDFKLENFTIKMREQGMADFASTTTSNVKVTNLQFYYIPASGNGPAGIVASTTITDLNGKNEAVFYTRKYIRK